ncbi:MAG: hypothetical protein IKK49_06625 [Clostridia bacterium]|nr:hypothetical protein [Clostridia bacterium]
MIDDELLLKKRFEELASRSRNKGIWVFSDFLSTAQQGVLVSMRLPYRFELHGGYEGAERRVACFGSVDDCGYECTPDFVCIKIEPVAQKFADELTHRDFFGSVMALGLKREVLGDIIVCGNCGYLFCKEEISGYICENLVSVKRTTVSCTEVASLPEISTALPEISETVVASQRLDALVCAVYGFSRSTAKELIEQGRVSVNSVAALRADLIVEEHDTVSVRGSGRFIFEGVLRKTKKDRLRAAVRIYK